jgi:hypothetical protein
VKIIPAYMCGMEHATILAYGYRRRTADLADLGAGHRVYIDHDAKRRERAEMLAQLRRGDVVRVLYLRDLGGSPVADRKYKALIEARGATLEEARPAKSPGAVGRPATFTPSPEQDAAIRAVWLDETRSLADRCQGVIDIYGRKVARFSLYRRYGKPGAPR